MATETFDKTIWIDEKAAEIIANELEKPSKPYVIPQHVIDGKKRGQEWLEKSRSKKSSAQKKK